MGITGLLPFLEKASKKTNLSEFRGYTVAIDTYCWLHKGAFACADKLARGENTDVHIQYCLKYVNLLLSYNIKPILVFDGRHLSAKELTEAKRREVRKNAKKRAIDLLRLGKTDEARSFLRRCVDITHSMALCLIKECRKRKIDCIVAPYEADAQLAFLNTNNIAQIVITEDSDLTLFGCTKILFKLDLQGNAVLVDNSKLHLAMGIRLDRFTFEKFRYMCILSGCDYLDSLPGIGLVKACKFIRLTEDPDIYRALLRIPGYLNMKNLTVTDEYRDGFMKADATFRHMLIYDPINRRTIPLTDPIEAGTNPEYCCNAGELLDSETALELALGNLDPFTMKRLDNWRPDKNDFLNHNSIWGKVFVRKSVPQPPDVRKVCFPSTFGKNSSIDMTKLSKIFSGSDNVEDNQDSTIATLSEIYGSRNKNIECEAVIIVEESQSPENISEKLDIIDHPVLDKDQYTTATGEPTTPKKSRNPFVRNFNSTQVTPEKLYENNSEVTSPIFKMKLSKNVSLIKSITGPKKGAKRKRLSKFSTTSIPDENIVSRFFKIEEQECEGTTKKNVIEINEVFLETPNVDSLEKYSRRNNVRKSHSTNTSAFRISCHDSEDKQLFKRLVQMNTEMILSPNKIISTDFKKPWNGVSQRTLITENEESYDISTDVSLINKTENCETDDIADCRTTLSQPLLNINICDKKKHFDRSQSEEIVLTNTAQTKSASCRAPGLTKTKSVSNSTTQSRLSMFGFKKRQQLSLS